jgi:TFIIF-interacting CTD phosphatase-like protein
VKRNLKLQKLLLIIPPQHTVIHLFLFAVDWYFEHSTNCGDFIIINSWIYSLEGEQENEKQAGRENGG